MKVYHGSYTEITDIDLNRCEVGKDFGRGFYVTNLHKQAEIWATRKETLKTGIELRRTKKNGCAGNCQWLRRKLSIAT